MSKRAAAAAQTRQRIVEAALDLHGRQGIAATSWEDIAARAGVGVGTVYRHFGSLDELIPACGDVAMRLVALPVAAETPALFDGVPELAARIERLVAEVFAIYERGAAALRVIRRESDVHPRVAQDRDAVDAVVAALVGAALAPHEAGDEDRRVVRALVDLGTWEALREQGLAPAAAVAAVSDLIGRRLAGSRAPEARR